MQPIPVADYRKMKRGTVNKYRNRKVKRDGMVFDSEKEYRRWGELKLLEKQGEIKNLERQVLFDLGANIFYVADFRYGVVFPNGSVIHVTEDVKGFRTAVYKLKKKLMLSVHGITIKEI